MDDLHTSQLRDLIRRIQQGDPIALNELLRRASGRLEKLARAMLRQYPRVRDSEQTSDVVQEASMSLTAALRQLTFHSTREFYGLAAEHIRRRLIDLARRQGRRPATLPLPEGENEPHDPRTDEDLSNWQALHEAVARLPNDAREAFLLRFYHGCTVDQVVEVMGISRRTAARLHARALAALSAQLSDRGLPGSLEG